MTQPGLSSITHLQVWSDIERFHSDVAFLLILPKVGVAGERVYGLAVVWVHSCQARVPTRDDVVRKLTLLHLFQCQIGNTFVHFNGDTHHIPLPREGHLSAMTDGMPSTILCGCLY